jgi:hypothetical protein
LNQSENDYCDNYKTHDSWLGRVRAVQRFWEDWRRPVCSLALMPWEWEQAGCHHRGRKKPRKSKLFCSAHCKRSSSAAALLHHFDCASELHRRDPCDDIFASRAAG